MGNSTRGGKNLSTRRTSIYEGRVVKLGIEAVRLPDGRTLDLEVVRHPGGAAVVALDSEGRVCLVRQYRHAAGGWVWEIPAGKLDPGEEPLATAKREAQEEAGVAAARWESLGSIVTTPGFCDEVIHLYLARDLAPATLCHGEHELIEVHWLPFSEALAWASDGRIRDAKTLVGLFRARDGLGVVSVDLSESG